jgi:hypothetical protein
METTLYYCFTNYDATTSTLRDYLARGLTQWTAYSNVRFVSEGNCASATRSSITIEASNYGGSAMGTDSPLYRPSMYLPMLPGSEAKCTGGLNLNECLRLVAGHEFGHALGFSHESQRRDYNGVCPNGYQAIWRDGETPDTFLTPYDPDSLLDAGYCRGSTGSPTLTQNDIAGLGAIYGRGQPTSCPSAAGCLYVRYGSSKHAIRFQNNGFWLKPTDTHGVEQQTFIGGWERITFQRLAGPANDGFVHYGDVIAIKDQWNYALSARDNGDVTMMPNVGPWERWIVETPDATRYPNLSKLLVNAPLRLRSEAFPTKRLEVSSSGDVRLTTATSTSHVRINGPLL